MAELLPNGNTTTYDGRCKYCGTSRTRVKIGRIGLGDFNKPGVVAMVCNICDRFSDMPHHPETDDGPEPDVQES